jgi:hypothetical protein
VDPTLIEFRAKIKVTLIETSPEQERNNRAAVAILGADESDEWFTIVKTKYCSVAHGQSWQRQDQRGQR